MGLLHRLLEQRSWIDVCVPKGWDREKKRDEMAHQRRRSKPFRCRRERMIEQFTITNPAIGYCCLLFSPQCHIKNQHAKGMGIRGEI